MTADQLAAARESRRRAEPPDNTRHAFPPRAELAAARESRGLSVTAVERATGVRNLKAIEGGFNCNLRYALILAAFYGLPVETLWSLADDDAHVQDR